MQQSQHNHNTKTLDMEVGVIGCPDLGNGGTYQRNFAVLCTALQMSELKVEAC